MKMTWVNFIVLSVIFFLISFVNCVRQDVHQMMYRTLDGAPACFRRLNGTHQFGCSSPRGGSFGVVHFVENETQVTDFLQKGVAGPYAVVLSPTLFRRDVLDSLIGSNKVSGLVLNIALKPFGQSAPESFSPDNDCPNKYSGVNGTCSIIWNPSANKFLLHDWPLPIFLVNNPAHFRAIAECHEKFNPPLDETQLSRPLCSLHLNSHMYAAVNSEICLRRINYYGVNAAKYCDPIGDENVVLPALPWVENATRNVIVVGARMDALSMFDGIAPGAMSAATGLITFLTTAHIFHKMLSPVDYHLNNDAGVLFILFNGEAVDYIGSSRVVYDMQQGTFFSSNTKVSLNNIRIFIELSQLSSANKVFVHQTGDKEVAEFLDYLNSSTKFDVKFQKSTAKEFPPASFQSFYKVDKNISGAILSNFDNVFINSYYNSLYDTANYLKYVYANGTFIDKSSIYDLQNRLAEISITLASYLYKKATSKTAPEVYYQKSVVLVDELLHCYIETRRCRIMKEVAAAASDKIPDLLPLYVGVRNNPENYVARATGLILAYLTGNKTSESRENCINDGSQKDYAYIWMNGESGKGVCIISSVLVTPAESPAFLIPGYDWKSGQYATWTESVWGSSSLGMFVKPNREQEIVVLSSGLLVLFLSFSTVFWFNKKSVSFFMPMSPTSC